MNELHFAFRVRQHLNQGLQQIDDDKLARLKTAREAALAARKKPSPVPVVATVGHFLRFNFDARGVRFSLIALTLVLCAALYVHWHTDQMIAELSEFDSVLLSEDVPVEALLDEDFVEWLRKPQER
ncbi:MAG: DUF3619 family protein [Rhodocyclaceae bacterium]|jgi:hypothetical protein|nr:DUF3619 family protein [Rhodocyclaceae bacterium]